MIPKSTSISSATSQQEPLIRQRGDHDAARGVVNATLIGVLLWCMMIGAWLWVSP